MTEPQVRYRWPNEVTEVKLYINISVLQKLNLLYHNYNDACKFFLILTITAYENPLISLCSFFKCTFCGSPELAQKSCFVAVIGSWGANLKMENKVCVSYVKWKQPCDGLSTLMVLACACSAFHTVSISKGKLPPFTRLILILVKSSWD